VTDVKDKSLLRQVFLNPTSRNLLALWSLLTGTTFDLKLVAELLALTESGLESKIQTLAGLGLMHVASRNTGERVVKFLPAPAPDLAVSIHEMMEGRKREFENLESRVRSQLYLSLLSSPS